MAKHRVWDRIRSYIYVVVLNEDQVDYVDHTIVRAFETRKQAEDHIHTLGVVLPKKEWGFPVCDHPDASVRCIYYHSATYRIEEVLLERR